MLIHYKFTLEVLTDDDMDTPTLNEILNSFDHCWAAHKGGHSKQYLDEDQGKALLRKWGFAENEIENANV